MSWVQEVEAEMERLTRLMKDMSEDADYWCHRMDEEKRRVHSFDRWLRRVCKELGIPVPEPSMPGADINMMAAMQEAIMDRIVNLQNEVRHADAGA